MIDRVIEVGWPCSFTGHIFLAVSLCRGFLDSKFCRNNRRMANYLSNLMRQVLKAPNVLSNVSRSFSIAMFLLT